MRPIPVVPSKEAIAGFMHESVHRDLNPDLVGEIYPVVHKRWIFRYGEDRVLKIRPDNSLSLHSEAILEAQKLNALLDFYNAQRGYNLLGPAKIDEINGFMVIDMPYMGDNITHLIGDLDRADMGDELERDAFKGFSREKAEQLIEHFEEDMALLEKFGYMHGDLFHQDEGPNNIVYNRVLDRLLVVDAEALLDLNSNVDRRNITTARENLERAEQWIRINMVV